MAVKIQGEKKGQYKGGKGPFDGADEIGGSGSAHPIEKIVEIRVGDM